MTLNLSLNKSNKGTAMQIISQEEAEKITGKKQKKRDDEQLDCLGYLDRIESHLNHMRWMMFGMFLLMFGIPWIFEMMS
jgi:hypothetical protein